MIKSLLICLLLLPHVLFGQQGANKKQDADQKFILAAFNKADEYMNTDHYDSAQVWLNKIYLKVSYRKPSLFSYFLTTRQAEVYYYNNLHELGMQEALKGENIARVLNDSLLIADASNFIGLFYLNNQKLNEAKKYFKQGLRYAIQPPYKKDYIELSKPHHIYGNLAETFEKLNQPDSAIYYCRISLKKATEIKSLRGMATGNLNLGFAFLLKNKIDSAHYYFKQSSVSALKSEDFDVELTSYGGLADCASGKSNSAQAFKELDKGFALLTKYPQLNDFYASIFLETATKIYRKYKAEHLLVRTLELKSSIQTATYNRNNTQIQTLLLMGLKNEKTIFNLELTESKNKQSLANTRLYIVLLVLLLFVIAFFAYRYYSLQRLRLANIRSKISQDLHDEVGATLSGIAMYSYITKEQIKNKEHLAVNDSLNIIKDNAGEMVAKLNDIVWAVSPVQDNLHALLERLKEFALQIASVKNIRLEFIVPAEIQALKLSMEQRKNIYLICKEAINNAVKYSNANLLQVKIEFANKHICIEIVDNGSGFTPNSVSKGNGLINMASRANEIKAKLEINGQSGTGTKVSLNCKIT
ncbi:MAG: hypothetical protein EOO90_22290 [Pedobacter sp.]|nr:MAG: hypothetical protein EOO90_22290 [Pedobacter sp.]